MHECPAIVYLYEMKRTKQTSAQEYQKRINKALAYIRANLDKPLLLSDVAREACFSEFHFHRIFSVLMHETLGEYVTRKKLERAAMKLAYTPALKVSTVAEEYGYASVSSFSKAFNEWFGCRPTELKKIKHRLDSGDGKLQTKYEKSIESNQLFVYVHDSAERFDQLDRRVGINNLPQTVDSYLTSPQGYNFESIWSTWQELKQRLEDAGLDWTACKRFAMSHDHPGLTPPERCRYDACVSLPEGASVNLDLLKTVIPAGRYAIFPVEGPEHSILGQYLEFYTVWMPQSGYEPDNFPVVERYLPSSEPGYLYVELWAKINPLTSGSQ